MESASWGVVKSDTIVGEKNVVMLYTRYLPRYMVRVIRAIAILSEFVVGLQANAIKHHASLTEYDQLLPCIAKQNYLSYACNRKINVDDACSRSACKADFRCLERLSRSANGIWYAHPDPDSFDSGHML